MKKLESLFICVVLIFWVIPGIYEQLQSGWDYFVKMWLGNWVLLLAFGLIFHFVFWDTVKHCDD